MRILKSLNCFLPEEYFVLWIGNDIFMIYDVFWYTTFLYIWMARQTRTKVFFPSQISDGRCSILIALLYNTQCILGVKFVLVILFRKITFEWTEDSPDSVDCECLTIRKHQTGKRRLLGREPVKTWPTCPISLSKYMHRYYKKRTNSRRINGKHFIR